MASMIRLAPDGSMLSLTVTLTTLGAACTASVSVCALNVGTDAADTEPPPPPPPTLGALFEPILVPLICLMVFMPLAAITAALATPTGQPSFNASATPVAVETIARARLIFLAILKGLNRQVTLKRPFFAWHLTR
jgi:hypothetical protein